MNPKLVEFALRKQRLQIHAEMQRADMVWRLEGIAPLLDGVDRVRDGVRRVREHIPIIATATLILVVVKPRLVLRIARRAWLTWLLVGRLRRGSGPLMNLIGRFGASRRRR